MENINSLRDRQNLLIKMLSDVDKICKDKGLVYVLAYGSILGAIRHKGFIPWDYDIDIMVPIDIYQRFCKIMENELKDEYRIYSAETDPKYQHLYAKIGLRDKNYDTFSIDLFPVTGAPNSRIGRIIFSKIAYIIHRCYFVKKVNINLDCYIKKPKSRRKVIIARIILFPIPAKLFLILFRKLSTMYSFQNSEMVYSICGTYGLAEFINMNSISEPVYAEFEGLKVPIPKEWNEYLAKMYGEDYMIPKPEWKYKS